MGSAYPRPDIVCRPDRRVQPPPAEAPLRATHGSDVPIVLYLEQLQPRRVDHLNPRLARALVRCSSSLLNDMGGCRADRPCCSSYVGRVRARLRRPQRLDALAAATPVSRTRRNLRLVPLCALCVPPFVVCGDRGCGEVIGQTEVDGSCRTRPCRAQHVLASI